MQSRLFQTLLVVAMLCPSIVLADGLCEKGYSWSAVPDTQQCNDNGGWPQCCAPNSAPLKKNENGVEIPGCCWPNTSSSFNEE